jgi:hypothetical protein
VLAAFDAVHALQQRHQRQHQQQQLTQVHQGATAAGRVPRFQPNSGQGTMFMAITAQLILVTLIGAYLVQIDNGEVAPNTAVDDLLRSPQLHRCLSLNACVAVMALAGSEGGDSSRVDSGGSGGGSSSSRRSSSREQARAQTREQTQQTGSCGSSQGTAGDWRFPVSPLTDRLFDLLGVDQETVQYATRQAPPLDHNSVLRGAQLISSLFWLNEVSCVWLRVGCCAVWGGAVHCAPIHHRGFNSVLRAKKMRKRR